MRKYINTPALIIEGFQIAEKSNNDSETVKFVKKDKEVLYRSNVDQFAILVKQDESTGTIRWVKFMDELEHAISIKPKSELTQVYEKLSPQKKAKQLYEDFYQTIGLPDAMPSDGYEPTIRCIDEILRLFAELNNKEEIEYWVSVKNELEKI